MKKSIGLGLLLTCISTVYADSWIGKPESELFSAKGKPANTLKAGAKVIYTWPDLQVTVVNGVVTDFRIRDISAEAADAARRKEAREAELRNAAAAANQKAETQKKTQEEEAAMQQRIQERQRQNAAREQKRSQIEILKAHRRSLSAEIDRLKGTQMALFNANRNREGNGMSPEIQAKQDELWALDRELAALN